jgi:CheY-like chemotaxis protein
MMRARILVVEDDDAVRRFIGLALLAVDADVVEAADVAGALAALREAPVDLVFTDLTLPGESGLGLIERLVRDPQLGAGAKVVVFSGGLHSAMRDKLAALGVWCCLEKPASLGDIEACVREALHQADWPEAPALSSQLSHDGLQPHELSAIETYFDGDRAFYETYRTSCIAQFAHDLSAGDMACQSRDAMALRRTAHGLKSVLQTLGYADHSVCAKVLEGTVQQGSWDEAVAGWQELRSRLVRSFGLEKAWL